jgi:hypothetical protein
VSVFYCGAIDIDPFGKGRFRIASDIHVSIEGYGLFKPSCRNQFVPQFKEGMKEGIRTVGAQNLSDGINDFVQAFEDNIGIEIRSLEPTGTGLYVVTATSIGDPQYGIGLCRPELEEENTLPVPQPSVIKQYPATGITRF